MTTALRVVISPDQLTRGLRPAKNLPRNSGWLLQSKGAVGYRGGLSTNTQLARLDTTFIADGFPYPQIFVFTNVILVCGRTKIYELVGGSLVERIAVSAGETWSAVDLFDFIYLSNKTTAVVRDATTKTYALNTTLPKVRAICNFNGQIIVGSI